MKTNIFPNNKKSLKTLTFTFILLALVFLPMAAADSEYYVDDEASLRAALAAAPTDGTSCVIIFIKDIQLTGTTLFIPNNTNITMQTDGESRKLSGANALATITVNNTSVLRLDGITVTHANGNTGRGVTVQSTGTLYLLSGSICNNTFSGIGGGVYNIGNFTMEDGVISDNAGTYGGGVYNSVKKFTMNGGKISDNKASSEGGGVYSSGTNFIMNNGTISGNKANASAGGVYVESGTFVMYDGEISNNTGTSGGGVYNAAHFTLENGKISDNTATSATNGGGGVINVRGAFTMKDGLISNNTGTYGGGVYSLFPTSTFVMSGGEISYNNAIGPANGAGGGVSILGSTFTMENATISNNSATFWGGGVYMEGRWDVGPATFNMINGTISDNTAIVASGGGVFLLAYGTTADFSISGDNSVIANNTAVSGGGVFNQYGSVTISDVCEIVNNTVENNGGGVNNLGSLMISGNCVISDNKADSDGGGVYNGRSSIATITDCKIVNNTAENDGGGVYNLEKFDVSGSSVISGNKAGGNGGGIWITHTNTSFSNLFVSAGAVFSNNKASAGYNIHSDDESVYAAQIKCTAWTDPFTQGYNNHDISYVNGEPVTMSYTLSFDANTGTGSMSDLNVKYGSPITLPANIFTKTNAAFSGWNEKADGTGTSYADNKTFTYPVAGDLTLYAQWKPTDSGGGNGGGGNGSINPPQDETDGMLDGMLDGLDETFEVRFVDWDKTLLKAQQVSFDESATAPANPFRAGYDFTGWDRGFTHVRSNMTVTAQYKQIVIEEEPPEVTSSAWSLINLMMAVIGLLLAIVVNTYMLLKKIQNSDGVTTLGDSNDERRQKQRKTMWLITAFVTGALGIAVFLLVEDMSLPMELINAWTLVSAPIFLLEIAAIAVIFKRQAVYVKM